MKAESSSQKIWDIAQRPEWTPEQRTAIFRARHVSVPDEFDYPMTPAQRKRLQRISEKAVEMKAKEFMDSATCEQCAEPMTGRSHKRFCSVKCRVAAHRALAW